MKLAVAKALTQSHTYKGYREIVSNLLAEGKASGTEQSEALTKYSLLNDTRMNRLDKTIHLADDIVPRLLSLKKQYIWLVLSEGWCGDAAQVLPVLNKMALATNNIDLRIVFRDQNPDLMNLFLTNGSRSIPKLIIIDSENDQVYGSWGPRPKGAANLISSYKSQYGTVDETAINELQLWYLHDKGASVQNEIIEMLIDAESSIYSKKL